MGKQALEGIKVLDFSWVVTGPVISQFLAQHGAQVVKVESTTRPDPIRATPPFRANTSGMDRSGYFANYNYNKLGVSLNLSHPRSRIVVERLVRWADLVLENFTPGVMERWGYGYEDLKKVRSDIVMISASMLGRFGPYEALPGHGNLLVSLAGISDLTGWPDRGPSKPYGAYTDYVAPPFGMAIALAALDYRRRTGRGSYFDISQAEIGVLCLAPMVLDYEANGRISHRSGNRCGYAVPHGVYPCRGDDRWCAITVFDDEGWENLCSVAGHPEWVADPRFATLLLRKQNEDELERQLSEWTAAQDASELMERLQAVGVAAGVVETCEEVQNDPQLAQRGHYWWIDHPVIGHQACDGPAFILSETPAQFTRPAPVMGQDNWHVYGELLGMDNEEFVELMNDGVFE